MDIIIIPTLKMKVLRQRKYTLDMHALLKCQNQDLNWGRPPSAAELLNVIDCYQN